MKKTIVVVFLISFVLFIGAPLPCCQAEVEVVETSAPNVEAGDSQADGKKVVEGADTDGRVVKSSDPGKGIEDPSDGLTVSGSSGGGVESSSSTSSW